MTIAASLLPEFDQEMKTTRSLLERVPEEHAGWKPHTKSFTLGALAIHVASTPLWASATLKETDLDLASPAAAAYAPPPFSSTKALLDLFDSSIDDARKALAGASDDDLAVVWSLKQGAEVILAMPRAAVIRFFVMNHLIHHRGQLSVYLRLKDVPLPKIYGPTADTND